MIYIKCFIKYITFPIHSAFCCHNNGMICETKEDTLFLLECFITTTMIIGTKTIHHSTGVAVKVLALNRER